MRTPSKRKIILITGAAGGLGQALSKSFSTGEYAIGLHVYQNIAVGMKLADRLKSGGIESDLFSADLRNPKAVKKMFDDLLKNWGEIDLLINNAGIRRDGLFTKISQAVWDEVVDTNLKSTFLCMREAGQAMQERKGGHIINISSYSALVGRVGQASYSSSKMGLIALTQSAAKEWGRDFIQVNAVLPGFLVTPMTSDLSPVKVEQIIQQNVLQRPSTTTEVSEFIFHLSRMSHVSGQVFNLDSRIS